MLTENQNLWLRALRSGKYKQTFNFLQDPNGYCCLGVACIVYEENTGKKLPRDEYGHLFNNFLYESLSNNFLDGRFSSVREWIGLSTSNGAFKERGINKSLAEKNDCDRLNFEEIADLIESEPLGLFIKEGDNNAN